MNIIHLRDMLRLLPGTLCIALSFLVLSVAFAGIGLAIRRAFGLVDVSADDLLTDFWMGFAAVILFLILWNFALPVDGRALTVVLGAGAFGLVRARASLAPLLSMRRRSLPTWAIAAVALAGLWIANLSSGGMSNWDSSLYHMQGVKWAHDYPVVPGLANLFGPLGFNNSSFLYDAMLDTGPWSGRAWHVANGLLVFMLATQAILGGARFLVHGRPRRAADLFAFLLLASVLDLAMDDHSSSFMTDIPLAAPRLVVAMLWYRSLVSERRDEKTEAYDLVCMVTLAALSVAIKMNAAIFAAVMVVTSATLWYVRRRPGGVALRRATLWCVGAGLLFGVAWTARGVILSGYPIYPSPVFGAPVDWRDPAEHARGEFDFVVHSSRVTTANIPYISGQIHGLRAWLPHWLATLKDDPFYVPIPVLVLIVMGPMLFVAWRASTADDRRSARDAWWILMPTVVALVAWFVVAPEPRYATSAFWTLVALLGSQAFAISQRRASESQVRRVFAAACLLGVSPLVVNPLIDWRSGGSVGNPLKAIVRANVRIPPPGEWYQPAATQAKLHPFVTRSGLVLNQPEQRCWDAALPCTPNPAPNLRLRVPGHIERGFTVDGEWQMQDWPYKWRPAFLAAWRLGKHRAD
jgi:hypothetical protein